MSAWDAWNCDDHPTVVKKTAQGPGQTQMVMQATCVLGDIVEPLNKQILELPSPGLLVI